ncbi:MAG: hypothetical protein ACOC80_10355, partial [Petrotogales bacterium]
MSFMDHRWYICETGKQCCVEQCVLFIDAPVDIRKFKRCPQEGEAKWRSMTAAEIKEVINTS